MQHDVQELNRVLCDNLEEKMKVRSPCLANVLPPCCFGLSQDLLVGAYAEILLSQSPRVTLCYPGVAYLIISINTLHCIALA